jgi:serine/threonine-protein kinase
VKGKPAYLAPEQLEGKKIDGRVDLFALGIVMHEMLSLEHLFAGDSDLGTVKKIMEMEIPAPSAKRPDVSPELDRIVMKALARDRDQRYATAAEMARDLDDFVIASRLRIDEVAAFVRGIEAEMPRPVAVPAGWSPAEANAPRTRKDLGLALRMWSKGRPGRRRGAVLIGAALFAAALATALGVRVNVTTTHNVAAAAESAPAVSATPTR